MPDQPTRGEQNADMRIEVVQRELNQGALAGFDSSVTGYAAQLVVAALDTYDAAALAAEYERGVRDGKVIQTIFGNSIENLQAEYDRGLAEGRQDVERLTLLLEQAEQYARDLQDGGIFLHDEAVATVRQEGLAEGRRQATEGWEREWGAQSEMGGVESRDREEDARRLAARFRGARLVSRLVGPWEPAEPKGSSA